MNVPDQVLDDVEDDYVLAALRRANSISAADFAALADPEVADALCRRLIDESTVTALPDSPDPGRRRTAFWLAAAVAVVLLVTVPVVVASARQSDTPTSKPLGQVVVTDGKPDGGGQATSLPADSRSLVVSSPVSRPVVSTMTVPPTERASTTSTSQPASTTSSSRHPSATPEASTPGSSTAPDKAATSTSTDDVTVEESVPTSVLDSSVAIEIPEGACVAVGDTIDDAQAAFAEECPGLQRFDCDPLYPGWMCSDKKLGRWSPPANDPSAGSAGQ